MPKPKAPWFVRFVVHEKDEDSGRRTGVFQAAYDLHESRELSEDEMSRLGDVLAWFGRHLPKPDRLTISARPHAKDQAISWLKESAVEHMAQMRAMVLIMEAHGLVVDRIRTKRPGYVVYEDEHQAAAYPFADTPT
jgi:hypothetical protein